MRFVSIVLSAELALASACATSTFAQDSVNDRIEAMEAELRDLGERAKEIEAELTALRAIAAGAGETIREARSNDEEHEFITYPVYRCHNEDLHVMLRRIGYVTYHDAEHRIPRWVTQRHSFNAGIWLRLENQVIDWAREHNEVWMICGPVLQENPPTLKDAGRVSIPAKFYKIVGRDTDVGVAVISFMFEHEPDEPHSELEDYIVSIRHIEGWTGIDFFSDLPQDIQDVLENQRYSMEFDGTMLVMDGAVTLPEPDEAQNTVYVTGSGTRYHLQNCRHVRGRGYTAFYHRSTSEVRAMPFLRAAAVEPKTPPQRE